MKKLLVLAAILATLSGCKNSSTTTQSQPVPNPRTGSLSVTVV